MRVKFFAVLSVLILAGNAVLAGGVVDEAATNRTQVSEWGPVENGLRCRVVLPAAIEQGMSIPVTVELQADPAKIPAGMQKLNASVHDAFLMLSLTDAKTGKQFEVMPYSDAGGPFSEDFNDNVVALDKPLKPWKVNFPLVTVYSNLAPADYVCGVAFSYPAKPPDWARGGLRTNAIPASWWHGTVMSGEFHMQVLRETPKSQIFWIPKRLVVTKELKNLHPSDLPPLLADVPVIRFHKADAQAVSLPVRNGHFLSTEIERNDELSSICGGEALIPDNVNAIDERYDYKGQDIAADYRIEVMEIGRPGGHLYFPGPGSPGYHLIWSRTFHVSCTAKAFRRMPATVVEVPPGTDRAECIELIKANPEVEELDLGKTGITDADMKLIGKLRHLRVLELYDTGITDEGVAQLRKTKSLRALYLQGSKVTNSGMLDLSGLTQLEELFLGDTSVTDEGAVVVSRFPNLKQLDLMNTPTGDATVERLPKLKKLEWLDLRGTRVTTQGAQCLTNLMHLSDLRLPDQVAR